MPPREKQLFSILHFFIHGYVSALNAFIAIHVFVAAVRTQNCATAVDATFNITGSAINFAANNSDTIPLDFGVY
jgi:hypothetical protein